MQDIFRIIQQNNLFSALSKESILAFADCFIPISFKPGEVIFNEGTPAEEVFLIISGEVSVSKHMGAGQRELNRIQHGCCFGEMALLHRENRTATITAIIETNCLQISKDNFFRLLDDNRDFERNLTGILINRIKNTERQANNLILKTYKTLLFSLANLAESRDNETGAHLLRVQRYCRLLAEKLSVHDNFKQLINPSFIENIYIVSPMHDIGKVATPDAILLKADPLTPDEFEIMKKHTIAGAHILKKLLDEIYFSTFEMAYNLTHYHHERYDGKGYPSGLQGNDIPLEARIMTLADVFDALSSKRVYKPPFKFDKVISIIKAEKGCQFDPLMAEIMLANIKEFQAIQLHYSDST